MQRTEKKSTPELKSLKNPSPKNNPPGAVTGQAGDRVTAKKWQATENYHQIRQRVLAAVEVLPALSGKCVTGGRFNLKKALHPEITLSPTVAANAGAFQFRLAAWQSRVCTIQQSTNLTDWTTVYTNTTSTNGVFDFTNGVASPRQYFRPMAAP